MPFSFGYNHSIILYNRDSCTPQQTKDFYMCKQVSDSCRAALSKSFTAVSSNATMQYFFCMCVCVCMYECASVCLHVITVCIYEDAPALYESVIVCCLMLLTHPHQRARKADSSLQVTEEMLRYYHHPAPSQFPSGKR